MKKQAKHRLVDMDAKEVSLVDVPANKRAFLLVKSDACICPVVRHVDDGYDVLDIVKDSVLASFAKDGRQEAVDYALSRGTAKEFIVEQKDSEFLVIGNTGDVVEKFDDELTAIQRAMALGLEKQAKEKDGLPKEGYAYVGDADVTSTWKLKLFESADDVPDTPSVSLTAMAAQALSPSGFRGNTVQIPEESIKETKKIVAEAWLKARRLDGQTVTEANLPEILKAEEDVEKTEAAILIAAAKSNIEAISNSISDASTDGDVGNFCKSIRSVQGTLRKAAGDTSCPIIPFADSGLGGSFVVENRDSITKTLSEAVARINKVGESIADCEVLDSRQESSIIDISDLIAKTLEGIEDPSLTITQGSSDHANEMIAKIDGAISDLACIRVGLSTATSSDVEEHDVSGDIAKAAAQLSVLNDMVKTISKADGAAKDMSLVSKMFQARWTSEGAGVFRVIPSEKVAEFETYDEAEFDALRRNVELISGIEKMMHFKVKQQGDKYVVCDSSANDKVVWEADTEQEAKDKADELNRMASEMEDEDSDAAADAEQQNAQKDTAEKAGAAMQRDRLNRLKSVVKMYKEALDDLLGGSKSVDKFQKVGSTLEQLVRELDAAKKSVNDTMGIDDKRGTDATPNAGSGVQPSSADITDAENGLTGEGTPSLADLMKQIEELKSANADRDGIAKSLRSEIAALKKTRVAPSTIPTDNQRVEKSDNGRVVWARDMASNSTV